MTSTSLVTAVNDLVEEFAVSDKVLNDSVNYFVEQSVHGLAETADSSARGLPMIPTFVTSVPTGEEKGTFLAVDLGGTNFRVCSLKLNGDSTYDMVQDKAPIPQELMVGNCSDFFGHLADRIQQFLETHHSETISCAFEEEGAGKPVLFKMGFTFSFPVDQTALNRGKLIRWTKGFDIKDAVGKDICLELQNAIDARNLPVHVAALVNDTVGTLMSRAYTKPSDGRTLIGCIFGTGTNGAYSERIKKIPKFDAQAHPEVTEKIMVINTEWGSFDNDLKVIPNTRFDKQVNENTPNKGFHMFEKRISGMFLGELLRLVLTELQSKKLLFTSGSGNGKLSVAWSADSSVPALIDGDSSSDLSLAGNTIKEAFGYETTLEERKQIQRVARAIGKRSGYLSAIPLAGLIIHTKALEKFDKIDIGADGSVVEFYPHFQEYIHDALRKTVIGDDEKRVAIGIAKDGSGVGAALCALVA
ncbi:glucokinase [Sugiyamaella lignohabitans]|uniref:Phosphotransferase n=1 Tax=Sugiyamaella lignohabitans TaxID=796027 RepID=A0A167CUL6_9ASCO|nr:glucokinase [Sugiyamaella lignohabitans]ANB12123.1 glucokinase [Sugiyamaella lignohabitans]